MAIYTFSTKTKKPEDEDLVHAIKVHCYNKGMNFSGLIIKLLRAYKKEHIDD